MPNEVPNPIRFSQDRTHGAYDAAAAHRFWRALVQVDRMLRALPHRLPRQGEPGAFLLGRLRPCGHPVLRTAGAAASRRDAGAARRRHPRSLFARGEQRRVLAGQRDLPAGRLLFLRLSRTARASAPDRSRPGRASTRRWAISSCPTRRCAPPSTPTPCCSTSCRRPIPPRPPPPAGTARRWNAPSGFPGRCAGSRRGARRPEAASTAVPGVARDVHQKLLKMKS